MGSTVRVEVVCAGTPEEQGRAQGAALRDKIVAAAAALCDLEAFRARQPRWLPFPLFRRWAARKARRLLAPALAAHAPAARDRLLGLSAGAGLPADTAWLLHALEALMASVERTTVLAPAHGCSALAVTGRRSAAGEPVIAHNFDYLPLVQPFYALRETRPRGGLASLDFTVAPLAGAVDGVNEAGLAVAYNYAFTADHGPPGPTLSLRVADVLARCRTVAEAADALVTGPRWGGGLLMLADAGGDLASLELTGRRAALRRPAGDDGALFHTNLFCCPETMAVEVPREAVYSPRAPKPLRGRRVHLSGELRTGRLAELMTGAAPVGLDDLARVMADHGPAGAPSFGSLCMHSDYWYTTACLQLLPRSRRMRAAYSTACRADYTDFTLGAGS